MKKNILLIEKYEIISRPTAIFLGRHGFEVSVKKNVQEAMEFFAENGRQCDLMIIDFFSKKDTEIKAFKEFLALEQVKMRKIPVIAHTIYNDIILNREFRELGVVAILKKPYDMKEILSIFSKLGFSS